MNDYDRLPNIRLLISVYSMHRIKFQVVLFFYLPFTEYFHIKSGRTSCDYWPMSVLDGCQKKMIGLLF